MVRGKKDKIDIDVDFDPESMSDLKKYQKRMEAQGLKLGGKNIRLPEKSKRNLLNKYIVFKTVFKQIFYFIR